MSEKIIYCRCCKKRVIVINLKRRYCENCSKYINRIITRLKVNHFDRIKKLKRDLEVKYKYIATIKESVNNKDDKVQQD